MKGKNIRKNLHKTILQVISSKFRSEFTAKFLAANEHLAPAFCSLRVESCTRLLRAL